MPDDLSGLADDVARSLHGEEDPPAPLPAARALRSAEHSRDQLLQLVRWWPVFIAVFGLSFVVWTVVQIVAVGRYHDALGRVEQRVKVLEEKLIEEKLIDSAVGGSNGRQETEPRR